MAFDILKSEVKYKIRLLKQPYPADEQEISDYEHFKEICEVDGMNQNEIDELYIEEWKLQEIERLELLDNIFCNDNLYEEYILIESK